MPAGENAIFTDEEMKTHEKEKYFKRLATMQWKSTQRRWRGKAS